MEAQFCGGRSRFLGQSWSIGVVGCWDWQVFGVLGMREFDDRMKEWGMVLGEVVMAGDIRIRRMPG